MGRAVVNGTQTQAPLGERQQVPFMAVSQVRCFSIHNSGKENTNIEFSIECIKLLTSFDGCVYIYICSMYYLYADIPYTGVYNRPESGLF